ncbi:MAG: hypothetical protein HZA36_01905 [Parcubacteria group bacterium]|nr:hypothetical protein [Parcubacteria group bacterium]
MALFFTCWLLIGYWIVSIIAQCKLRNESGTWTFIDRCIGLVAMCFGPAFFIILPEYFWTYGDKESFTHPLWSWPWYSKK